MQFIKKHWVTIAAVIGALEAVYAAIDGLLQNGEAPTGHQVAVTAGVALFTYMMRRPGDLSKQQANEHAEKAAVDAVKRVSQNA